MSGLNTGRMYLDLCEIRVGCTLDSSKIRMNVFRFYEFQINLMDLERLFLGYFSFFFSQNKLDVFVT